MDGKVTLRDRTLTCLLCGALVTVPLMASAANTATATVTVKVTVVAQPCSGNGGGLIEVKFGDVMTTRVDGNNYRVPVNYTLSCPGGVPNAMKLQVKGNGASFDGTVLQTDARGLGIKLLQGSNKLPINTWLNFTYPNPPQLWAVPVKQPGVTLAGGQFQAVATLTVDYQ